MNKYIILIALNGPLALYGLFSVFISYKLKKLRRTQMLARLGFWGIILAGILFVKPISDFLYEQELTDTPPLSIFDVLLITGLTVSFLLIARAYGRISELETRHTQLHEKLSILLSEAHHTAGQQPVRPQPAKRRHS